MNVRKFTLIFYAGVIIASIAFAMIPQRAQAQCPVGAVCTPEPPSGGGSGGGSGNGGGGNKNNNPTPIPFPTQTPTSTPTPTPTPTSTLNAIQTFTAETLTAEAILKAPAFNPADATATALQFRYLQCYATIFPPLYQTAAAALTQTSNDWSSQAEATADVAVNWCAYGTPSSPTPVFIPPIAGPNFLAPGVINMIIAVLIIVVSIAGLFLLLRSRRGGGSPNADDLNPQPLPPKGMGDGSSQFQKADNQFLKVEDGSNQFQKADDQFLKMEDS
ncbi:MAG: hypothetical protein HYX49_05295 [Chloroflexi bacterium]|nr:hypothetical protein [Chloroflexota bacterium]